MFSEQTKKDLNGAGSDTAARTPSALAALLMRRLHLAVHVAQDDRSPATDRRAPTSHIRPENNGTKTGEVKGERANDGG